MQTATLTAPREPQKIVLQSPLAAEVQKRRALKFDWRTIDWMESEEAHGRYRARKRREREEEGRGGGFVGELPTVASMSQGLAAALICGLVLAFCSVFAEACVNFVVYFRIGICDGSWWLKPSFCCIHEGGGEECSLWYTWGEWFSGRNGRHRELIDAVFYIGGTVFFGVCAALCCKYYCQSAAGGGINEIKTVLSGQDAPTFMGFWAFFIKLIGMCFSVGSGLAVGKEGPFVHMGAAAGNLVAGLFPEFRSDGKRRDMIAMGVAAGVAVAFGAPVGGIIFALEELCSRYNFRAMLLGMIGGLFSIIIVRSVDLNHTGRVVQYGLNYRLHWHMFEVPMFALLGIICGIFTAFYNRANVHVIRNRKKNFTNFRTGEVFLLSLFSGITNYYTPLCMGSMPELLYQAYAYCSPKSESFVCKDPDQAGLMIKLIVAGLLKMFQSCITLGSLIPGGFVIPSLIAGGLWGRVLGMWVETLREMYPASWYFSECAGKDVCVMPGLYAVVGSAAMLTGVSRITIALVMILTELTGGVDAFVPLVIGTMFAKWAGEALGVESVIELALHENNVPYLDNKRGFYHDDEVCDIYEGKSFVTIPARGATLGELMQMLDKHAYMGFPIVASKSNTTFMGFIWRQDLAEAIDGAVTLAKTTNPEITAGTPVSFLRASVATAAVGTLGSSLGEIASSSSFVAGAEPLDFSQRVNTSSVQVAPDATIARVLHMFQALGLRHVIVTRQARFIAIVTKKNLIAYLKKVDHEHDH